MPESAGLMIKTSASLLERLARPGDQEAWERFAKLYSPMILQWERQAGLEENAAADLVQNVFVILFLFLNATPVCGGGKSRRRRMARPFKSCWRNAMCRARSCFRHLTFRWNESRGSEIDWV